jgi:hypothetical protein
MRRSPLLISESFATNFSAIGYALAPALLHYFFDPPSAGRLGGSSKTVTSVIF